MPQKGKEEEKEREEEEKDKEEVVEATEADPAGKKKRKKKKKKATAAPAAPEPVPLPVETWKVKGSSLETEADVRVVEKSFQDLAVREKLQEFQSQPAQAKSKGKVAASATLDDHDFWTTQPMQKLTDRTPLDVQRGPLEKREPILTNVKPDPYPLPPQLEWVTLDIGKESQLKELYTLLYEHYVEDHDAMFRFNYSSDFLYWALKPPGWLPQWHLGIRAKPSGALVGFISAVPTTISLYDDVLRVVEINFLCVHAQLRTKKLAPLLIQEITRLVNLQGIFQAVYTVGKVLPKPVATTQYFHRSLNPKKLISVGFSQETKRLTRQRAEKLYRLPTETTTVGLRTMEARDVPAAWRLLDGYLTQFKLHINFTEDEFRHWFLPRKGVVHAYVVEESGTGRITDFVSFYDLPSTVIGNQEYSTLRAAYSFYTVATSTPIDRLMNDALILAKNADFDVFNCLNLMDNATFIDSLKFGPGDGNLQYYVFNWRAPPMKSESVGLVLL